MKNETLNVKVDIEKITTSANEVMDMLETKHGLDAVEGAFASVLSAIGALGAAHPDYDSLSDDTKATYLHTNIANIVDAILKK